MNVPPLQCRLVHRFKRNTGHIVTEVYQHIAVFSGLSTQDVALHEGTSRVSTFSATEAVSRRGKDYVVALSWTSIQNLELLREVFCTRRDLNVCPFAVFPGAADVVRSRERAAASPPEVFTSQHAASL